MTVVVAQVVAVHTACCPEGCCSEGCLASATAWVKSTPQASLLPPFLGRGSKAAGPIKGAAGDEAKAVAMRGNAGDEAKAGVSGAAGAGGAGAADAAGAGAAGTCGVANAGAAGTCGVANAGASSEDESSDDASCPNQICAGICRTGCVACCGCEACCPPEAPTWDEPAAPEAPPRDEPAGMMLVEPSLRNAG